jgi:hypothetical protein
VQTPGFLIQTQALEGALLCGCEAAKEGAFLGFVNPLQPGAAAPGYKHAAPSRGSRKLRIDFLPSEPAGRRGSLRWEICCVFTKESEMISHASAALLIERAGPAGLRLRLCF